MNRFLYISFITLALVIGVAGAAPVANAQYDSSAELTAVNEAEKALISCMNQHGGSGPLPPQCQDFENAYESAQKTYLSATGGDPSSVIHTEAIAPAADTKTPVVNKDTPAKVDTSVKDTANTGQNNSTVLAAQSQDSILDGIMMKIMSLFALLVGVAALLLDWTMYYTVVTMGNYVSNLTAVGVAWRILRDLSNIALIFGFLAIGISIILETNWYGGGTKLLPKLLMAAVFLNFSLFFTEAVIDGGNLLATQFYTQINGGVPASKVSLSLTTVSNEGISNKIMSQLGLQSIYGDARNANTEIFKAGNPWLIGFMGILLFLITAFVLFSLAFILIARFVALIFIIILAPIGFIGFAVPQLSSIGNKWKDELIKQTITAPVLLLMLYIALAVITDAQFLTGFGRTGGDSNSATGFVGGLNLPGFASFLLSFVVAMGLLLAVVIYSKQLGAFGASWAAKTAGKLTFGATAFGLRSTIGMGSNAASQAIRRSSWGGTKRGRLLAGTFDRGAKASFDVRGTGVLKKLPFGGVDAGSAQKGGYRAQQEASVKGHEDYAKSIGKAGATKKEEKAAETAAVKQAEAKSAHDTAKNEYEAAEEQMKNYTEEVARLDEEEKRDKYWQTNPENLRKKESAKQNLKTSKENLAAINTRYENAKTVLGKAEEEKKKASGATGARISESQQKYGENIKGLQSLVMFGPGGSAAAKKIKKEAKQSPEQKMNENIKKFIEKSLKEESKEEGEKKEEKPKEA